MKKYILLIFTIIISLTCLTGCNLKRDIMEDIDIVTTIYPIEYVTNRLYGQNNTVKSIYPRSVISKTYKMTNKQLKDFSDYDLFIYNGESNEKDFATKMLNNNKNLRIIDAAYGLTSTYSDSDVWLNPSNILMIGQNIKNELKELIVSKSVIKEVENNYEQLKVDITVLETELSKTSENSINNVIVVSDESLNFLEKYGFDVINLTKKGKEQTGNIERASKLIEAGKLNYLFVMEHSNDYDIINTIKNSYDIEILTFRALDTITDKDVDNNEDYISLMNYNIDLLKKETYK